MTHRRFRRSPEIKPRVFDSGPNPFSDESSSAVPHSDNPLAPSVTDEVQPFRPIEYEQTLSDRSGRVLILGITGCCIVGVSMLIAVIVMFNTAIWATELVYSLPTNLLGMSLCIPAWIMARADLRAMYAGAMDDAGLRSTRIAYWCGMLGTICGAFPFANVLLAIVLSMIS